MHRLARVLQKLHYLARFLREVCFWTNLAKFLQKMLFCSTRADTQLQSVCKDKSLKVDSDTFMAHV